MHKKLLLEIWSDIACPWCYVGKRRLETALGRFPYRDDVEVVWRAFELDPQAPAIRDKSVSYAERLARKYGKSASEAEGMLRQMTGVAAADGLSFDFARIQSGNTFDAHRLLHHAASRGLQGALKERFLAAYMCEGEPIGDREVLTRLAVDAGLDREEVRVVLETGACAAEVRSDEARAQALGIRGVPFFLFDGRLGVSGAQSAEYLLAALHEAWDERGVTQADEAAVCGPDGCD